MCSIVCTPRRMPVIDLRSASARNSERVGMGRAIHGGPSDSRTSGDESNRVPSSSNAEMSSARTWWNRMSIDTYPSRAPVSRQISHRGCAWSNGRPFSSTQVAKAERVPDFEHQPEGQAVVRSPRTGDESSARLIGRLEHERPRHLAGIDVGPVALGFLETPDRRVVELCAEGRRRPASA